VRRPRLLCGCGAQEARLDTDIGEGRGRTRLLCLSASRPDRSRRCPHHRPLSHGFGGTANGGGSTTVNRRGSVATCLSLPSVTDFRKSRMAGSARRPCASCKRWRRPCGQGPTEPRPEASIGSGRLYATFRTDRRRAMRISRLRRKPGRCGDSLPALWHRFRKVSPGLEHVLKKLLDFFDF
jgi:hypothetical protein